MKHRFLYIYSAFLASLFILVLLAFLFLQLLDGMITSYQSLENAYKVLNKVQALDAYLNEMESGSRGYMLTRDSIYLNPLTRNRKYVRETIDSLENMVADDKQKNKLAFMRSTINLRMRMLDENVRKVTIGDTLSFGTSLLKGKFMMEDVRRELSELRQRESMLMDEHLHKRTLYEQRTPGNFKTILFFTSLITLVGFFFLNKELRRRLKYQRQLERKLNELHRSNEELQQIAYVASHDLQEPLRKIRMFSNRLQVKHAEHIDDEVKLMLSRIDASANHMHELLHEIINFTNLIDSTEEAALVDLQVIIYRVLSNCSAEVQSKKAVMQVDPLPVIYGYANQLYLLFASLLDNALKFTREGVLPVISIRLRHVESDDRQYHCISVEDNGIGFDNEFGAKIFVLFQRLHAQKSGFAGKGIGLAIVQRVMVNHDGRVYARGEPERGAVFELHFPIQE